MYISQKDIYIGVCVCVCVCVCVYSHTHTSGYTCHGSLASSKYILKAIYGCTLSGFPGSSDGQESTCNAGDQVQSLGQEDPLGKSMPQDIHA